MNRWLATIAIIILSFVGCGKEQPLDKVIIVEPDDPRMNAAIEKARATVKTFIAALQSPKPGQSGFAIKVDFTDNEEKEYMWLQPVTFDGSNFTGVVDNVPQLVKSVKRGQKVTVAPHQISDWMYIDNGRLIGGETLRVIRDSLTPQERADFDKSLPFIID
jgi:uncharacterized protein YegJ (DUF2314 family)